MSVVGRMRHPDHCAHGIPWGACDDCSGHIGADRATTLDDPWGPSGGNVIDDVEEMFEAVRRTAREPFAPRPVLQWGPSKIRWFLLELVGYGKLTVPEAEAILRGLDLPTPLYGPHRP